MQISELLERLNKCERVVIERSKIITALWANIDDSSLTVKALMLGSTDPLCSVSYVRQKVKEALNRRNPSSILDFERKRIYVALKLTQTSFHERLPSQANKGMGVEE